MNFVKTGWWESALSDGLTMSCGGLWTEPRKSLCGSLFVCNEAPHRYWPERVQESINRCFSQLSACKSKLYQKPNPLCSICNAIIFKGYTLMEVADLVMPRFNKSAGRYNTIKQREQTIEKKRNKRNSSYLQSNRQVFPWKVSYIRSTPQPLLF